MRKTIGKISVTKLIIILCAALILLVGLNLLLDALNNRIPKKTVREKVALYSADYTADIFTDEEYMSEENFVLFSENGSSVRLYNSDEAKRTGELAEFLFSFFRDMIYGNYKGFNEYFSDDFFRTNDRFGKFTMQRIYNIEAEVLSKTEREDKTVEYSVKLVFSIMKNDGTVFDFIPSDTSKPMYLTVIDSYRNDSMVINTLDY